MTVNENEEKITLLEERLHFVEKILDLIHPIWRYEEIEHIKEFEAREQ